MTPAFTTDRAPATVAAPSAGLPLVATAGPAGSAAGPRPAVTVRPARAEDEALLLRWRNDPAVAARGLSGRTVSAEEHRAWFAETLERRRRELSVIEVGGTPAGAIRFDFEDGDEAVVSIYLVPPYPGRGYGRDAFLAVAPDVFLRRRPRLVVARVRAENAWSARFFRRLGFRDAGWTAAGLRLELERPVVPHSRPWIGEAEAAAAQRVIAGRQLAAGPEVEALEAEWCRVTGTAGAAAVASGVGGLRLALLALGVGEGDEVMVPAYACVAVINAALALDAWPVLADVTPGTWTLDPEDAERRLTSRTRAIVAVHLFGAPAPVGQLATLGLPVVEDCAHGIGGRCGDRPFGGAGALSVSSFYATKLLAAGEGGIVAATDPALAGAVCATRGCADRPPDGRVLNDKLSDLSAAVARAQLARLDEILARRAAAAARYGELLAPLAERGLLELPAAPEGRVWYRYAVRLLRHGAAEMAAAMAGMGVRAERPVWDHRATSGSDTLWPVAALAFERLLSLPLYPDLTPLEQRTVCAALERCLR